MKITDGLHRLKISFKVTENIERFVYMYMIIGEKIHIIDTGVAGSETYISNYLAELGRYMKDIDNILLTHSHPDHIGSLQTVKELSKCTVYACDKERSWIEDIDIQFKERPIPNFYGLVNQSAQVDIAINDGDILKLESGITIKVLETNGHSQGSMSFYWIERQILFTGDSIPVIGEIPIFISVKDSVNSLKKLLAFREVDYYLSAWDNVFDNESGRENIEKSLAYLLLIEKTVKDILSQNTDISKEEAYVKLCDTLGLKHLFDNPLFRQSIYFTINEA